MEKDQLNLLYRKLYSLIEDSESVSGKDYSVFKTILEDGQEEVIYSSEFIGAAGQAFIDFLHFEEAQILLEEALSDQSLTDEIKRECSDKLEEVKKPGFRRFAKFGYELKKSNFSIDPEKAIEELKKVIQEGYEVAGVWALLGDHYAELKQQNLAIDAYKKCLEVNEKTQDIDSEERIEIEDNLKLLLLRKEKIGGCFIATAVYGSSYANEVIVLKQFRNEYLLNNFLGRQVTALYYNLSPSIAKIIQKSNYLKVIVKYIVIVPLIKLIRRMN